MSTKSNAVSPLRRCIIEDMTIRRFMEKTQGDYVLHVRVFAAFLDRSPEQAEPEDLRRFQRHMAAGGARPASMNAAVSALRFFFQITLGRAGFGACLAAPHSPECFPVVLSTDEVARLLGFGARAVADRPGGADATTFCPRLHALVLYLKTFQALSYERLQGASKDLFGLTVSQGGLTNMLRRAEAQFAGGRHTALAALHSAKVVACDETGISIEGTNNFHWVFRCAQSLFECGFAPAPPLLRVEDQQPPGRAVWRG